MEFKDKVVIVTGGASGIGAETIRRFTTHGATVICADINEPKEEVKGLLVHNNSKFLILDVRDLSSVENMVNEVTGSFGKIDVLVNNAGIMNRQRTISHEHSLEDWDSVIAINQTGVFYCMRSVLKVMSHQKSGSIVNVASLAGLKGSGYNLAYSASKFAVVGMTKSAALEYAALNIRINAVCPSYTETPMLQKEAEANPILMQKLLKATPMKRFGKPEEIAETILWLASDKAEFMTGQTLTLDGGLAV